MKPLSIITSMLLITASIFTSCKNTEQSSVPPAPPKDVLQDDKVKDEAHLYSLVVSFYSVASGIDQEMRKKFENFLDEYQKENKIKLSVGIHPWGREGEVDYCIDFEELSTKAADKFISEVKKTLKGGKHVNIQEKARCVHKR